MNPKQDRPAARTPEDLERKYNFGENFHEIKETFERQNIAMEKQSQLFSNYVGTNDKALQTLVENYSKLLEKVSAMEGNLKKVDNRVTATTDNLCKAKAGFIYPFAGGNVPDGFLLCNGSSYSRTAYPELFTAIGTTYGAGDGSTTFNVPNYAGRVLVGAGSGYALGATGGEQSVKLTNNNLPAAIGLAYGDNDGAAQAGTQGGAIASSVAYVSTGIDGFFALRTNSSQIGHNNMQPYTVANYIIATGKTFVNTSTT